MAKILILYYSTWGHIETMADAIAEGARSVEGTEVTIKRVPETMSAEISKAIRAKLEQTAPLAKPGELAKYDGIIFGTPVRFGGMAGQMRNFLDQTGLLWVSGALIGKVGSAFTSSGAQHGGQEAALLSFHTTLLHHGMVIVGLPYSAKEQNTIDEMSGGSPYGATTIPGPDGKRNPSANELTLARFQGRHVAEITSKLFPA